MIMYIGIISSLFFFFFCIEGREMYMYVAYQWYD